MTPIIQDMLAARARRQRRDALLAVLGLVATFIVLAFAVPRAFAAPADGVSVVARDAETVTIAVRGMLNADDAGALRRAVEGSPRAVLLLDTPGGDLLAALRMGRIAREAQAVAVVSGRCASACLFILAGAVERYAADHAVGIHRPAVTRFVAGVGLVEIPPQAGDWAREAHDYIQGETRRYLRALGLPDTLHRSLADVAFRDMRWLTLAELRAHGIAVAPATAWAQRPVAPSLALAAAY